MENSNTQAIQLQIGKLLLIGILVSVFIVSSGGIYYLISFGHESIYTQSFYLQKPQPTTLDAMFAGAINLTPLGIIQFGVFILVVTQLLRVMLVTWYFVKIRDRVFVAISLFILLVVTYSLLWKF
ncbi:MAG: DUF1634 domain-containing protein [Gammaproteobacteria bacterium]